MSYDTHAPTYPSAYDVNSALCYIRGLWGAVLTTAGPPVYIHGQKVVFNLPQINVLWSPGEPLVTDITPTSRSDANLFALLQGPGLKTRPGGMGGSRGRGGGGSDRYSGMWMEDGVNGETVKAIHTRTRTCTNINVHVLYRPLYLVIHIMENPETCLYSQYSYSLHLNLIYKAPPPSKLPWHKQVIWGG